MAEAKIPLTKEERKTKCEEFLKLSDIRQEWFNFIIEDSDLCRSLSEAYERCRSERGIIIPTEENILAALRYCSPADVKVIILGQDPIRKYQLVTGLAFSLPHGTTESNTYTSGRSVVEVHHALRKAGIEPGESLCHEHWAFRGVLLFNVCPTFNLCHKKENENPHFKYWEEFTTDFLKKVLKIKDQLPKFVLCWGIQASKVGKCLNTFLDTDPDLKDEKKQSANPKAIVFLRYHPTSSNIADNARPFHVQAAMDFKTIEKKYPGLFTSQDEYEAICRQTLFHNKTALMCHFMALTHYLLVAWPKDMYIFYRTFYGVVHFNMYIELCKEATKLYQGAKVHHKEAYSFATTQCLKEYHLRAAEYYSKEFNYHNEIVIYHSHHSDEDKYLTEEAREHSEKAREHSEKATLLPLQTTDTHSLYQALDRFLKKNQLVLDTNYQSGTTSQADDHSQDGIRSISSCHQRAIDFNRNASSHHQNATDFHTHAKEFHLKATEYHQVILLLKSPNGIDLDDLDHNHKNACEYHDNEVNYHQEAAEYHRHISIYYQNTERYHHNAAIYHGEVGVTNNDDSVLTDIDNLSMDEYDANPSASS